MTKIKLKKVVCKKCKKESEQPIIYSVNFLLGSKKSNENLLIHQQFCPHCGYTARRIDN